MTSPIFLLASERSGTNLLRRRLSERQQTWFGPAPLHVLKHLYALEPLYGDLNQDAAFRALISDILGMAYKHFAPWDVTLDTDQVINGYPHYFDGPRSVIGVMHTLNSLYAAAKGYRSYLCKDNNLFDYIYPLSCALPEARFIYLYRDPRDQITSQIRRPLKTSSVRRLADAWVSEQLQCLRAITDPAIARKTLCLSYEDLITDESATIGALCAWLGVETVPIGDSPFSAESTEIMEWKNLSGATMTGNFGGYKTALSANQIRLVEQSSWAVMRKLGYPPDNPTRPRAGQVGIGMDYLNGLASDGWRRLFRRRRMTAGQLARQRHVRSMKARLRCESP
ncbi:MAG: sulfotransferase [Gammaproteobacteria bacterium]